MDTTTLLELHRCMEELSKQAAKLLASIPMNDAETSPYKISYVESGGGLGKSYLFHRLQRMLEESGSPARDEGKIFPDLFLNRQSEDIRESNANLDGAEQRYFVFYMGHGMVGSIDPFSDKVQDGDWYSRYETYNRWLSSVEKIATPTFAGRQAELRRLVEVWRRKLDNKEWKPSGPTDQNSWNFVLRAPTGSGKTIAAGVLVKALLSRFGDTGNAPGRYRLLVSSGEGLSYESIVDKWADVTLNERFAPNDGKCRVYLQVKCKRAAVPEKTELETLVEWVRSKRPSGYGKFQEDDWLPRIESGWDWDTDAWRAAVPLERDDAYRPYRDATPDDYGFYHLTFQEYLAARTGTQLGSLIHRDLKPHNVFIVPSRCDDFGVRIGVRDEMLWSTIWAYCALFLRSDNTSRQKAAREWDIGHHRADGCLIRMMDCKGATTLQLIDETLGEFLSATRITSYLWAQIRTLASLMLSPLRAGREPGCIDDNAVVLRILEKVRRTDEFTNVVQNALLFDRHPSKRRWWLSPELSTAGEDGDAPETHKRAASIKLSTHDNGRTKMGDGDGDGDGPPLDVEIFEEDGLTTIDGFVVVDRRRAFITLKRELSDDDKKLGRVIMLRYAYENSDMGVFYWHRRKTDGTTQRSRNVRAYQDTVDADDPSEGRATAGSLIPTHC